MSDWLDGKSVAVTGGTGSFGKAFVRHALEHGVARIVVFSRDELKQSEMRVEFPDERLRFMIGTVTDEARLRRVFRGIDYVVHAAAMKQVPACEAHPWEALRTNTMGAQAVASACLDVGVTRAVYLSTDKAAAPNTLYGATKLAGERIWIGANVYAAGRDTRFVATRYGNVIGSRGSVVPIFAKIQAQNGETGSHLRITVTDPDMTRFWMTLGQAVDLVRTALTCGHGGEIFIPKAPSCSLATVAEAFAPDCRRIIVGARRGEKMHETLISADESRDTRDVGDHYRIEPERVWDDDEYSLPGLAVADGWEYRSDTNDWKITAEELRTLWP